METVMWLIACSVDMEKSVCPKLTLTNDFNQKYEPESLWTSNRHKEIVYKSTNSKVTLKLCTAKVESGYATQLKNEVAWLTNDDIYAES